MKSLLLFCAMLLLLMTAAPAVGRTPQASAKGEAKGGASDGLAKAKKIYAVDCAVCHGDNGNGKTDLATSMELKLSDWTDPKSLADKSDQDLFDVIRKGKDKMPPEEAGRANDDAVKGLVQYLRSLSAGK